VSASDLSNTLRVRNNLASQHVSPDSFIHYEPDLPSYLRNRSTLLRRRHSRAFCAGCRGFRGRRRSAQTAAGNVGRSGERPGRQRQVHSNHHRQESGFQRSQSPRVVQSDRGDLSNRRTAAAQWDDHRLLLAGLRGQSFAGYLQARRRHVDDRGTQAG
jgi:hypothetical protein